MQPCRVVFTDSIPRVTPGAIHIIALQANGVKTLRIKNFSWYATLSGWIYEIVTPGYTQGYSHHCPSGKLDKDTSDKYIFVVCNPFRVGFMNSLPRVTPRAIHIIALQANAIKTLRIK